jgi:Rhodopirellula transposase DDE domain
VTSDGLVDGLRRGGEGVHDRCAPMTTWVINLDNGPENQRRRPQCMRRIVDLAPHTGLPVRLASSPPSQRKDKPIERCWGIRENHWNGALLDSIEAGIRFALTRTWQGQCPVGELITTNDQSGVQLTKNARQMVETPLQRLPGLDKGFVAIVPTSSTIPTT